ncbi:uncharacterized protein LOC121908209 isoform X1 [Scomber scombrus]|uniref:Uncharacterized protein LOC121908209 isoform X1 n=1 Tax=Scomber scombrus TaxID=13677 RepID=A0AAV1Q1W1_SCOSC
MAHIVLLAVVCVLCSLETQGSSAVAIVFVQKGKDLHLDVNKPVVLGEYDEFRWRVSDTHNVVRLFPDNTTRIVDPYKGRVEFSVQNHSLLLKNVQHSDSGDYTALITGDKNQRVAEYKVIIQVVVCVLCSWQTHGSSAVTTVFVQKGKNLHLDVHKPVVLGEDTEFSWTYNNTHNVVRLFNDKRTKISDSYKRRVEFSVQNHSLILKNVQHSDSGDYTALIIGDNIQQVAEYKVIIQDPVSPVQLSVNSVSNSTDSCNLTVTCSTEDSLINSTFRCDNQTCNQEGGEQSEVTTSGSSLRVYLFNGSIICNHSNQVSWIRDKEEIRLLCSATAGTNLGIAAGIGIGAAVLFCLVLGCLIIYQKCFGHQSGPNQNDPEDASGRSFNFTIPLAVLPTATVHFETETDN